MRDEVEADFFSGDDSVFFSDIAGVPIAFGCGNERLLTDDVAAEL